MKVTLKNGKTVDVNNSYGSRLIEQGRAVIANAKHTNAKAEMPAEQPAAEGKTAKKSGKGD